MEEFLRRDEHEKLYLKLYEILKMKIEKGEWTVGIQIPTEEQLCKNYDVSRATVRNAISELVREGYLKRIQGKGTFVVKKVTPRESITINLKDIMKEHGTFLHKSVS
ncbi:Transcriptional regulator, GntR family [Thermodesulfovibrio sp. N1]|uniref:GntR family transcriptional regulator n=1 Tax=Thermodesulfovibrio sp. N1 TaxID=1871110 RepID=UPI00083AE3DA|nr:GntR family transcriptional regulator [Thermodesulfovibrio sp. N1]ODA44623.1 Transcriptional regulator, GntR family [Thermodesulfovibrio sp. N1]